MEMEGNLDELFDFNDDILPEIYSIISQPLITNSDDDDIDHHPITKRTKIMNPSCYGTAQEINITSTTNPISSSSSSSAATPKLLSFENSTTFDANVSDAVPNCNSNYLEENYEMAQMLNFSSSAKDVDCVATSDNGMLINQKTRVCTATTSRTIWQARDHLIAERKRRENLGQLFISLSKVLPGLKKLDKASLLEDAINHLKALQEQVRVLEEEMMSKKSFTDIAPTGSYKPITSPNIIENNNTTINSESSSGAEIQVRISDKHVLIKVHCKKQKDLMSKVPCRLEKMHLSVLDMRIMPFGDEELVITLLAEMQMQIEFGGTVKEIVENLEPVFFNRTKLLYSHS